MGFLFLFVSYSSFYHLNNEAYLGLASMVVSLWILSVVKIEEEVNITPGFSEGNMASIHLFFYHKF